MTGLSDDIKLNTLIHLNEYNSRNPRTAITLSTAQLTTIYQCLTRAVRDELEARGKANLPGIAKLMLVSAGARVNNLPNLAEPIVIPARRRVRAKAAPVLQEAFTCDLAEDGTPVSGPKPRAPRKPRVRSRAPEPTPEVHAPVYPPKPATRCGKPCTHCGLCDE